MDWSGEEVWSGTLIRKFVVLKAAPDDALRKSRIRTQECLYPESRRPRVFVGNKRAHLVFYADCRFTEYFVGEIPHVRESGRSPVRLCIQRNGRDHGKVFPDAFDTVLATLVVSKRLPMPYDAVQHHPCEPSACALHEPQFGADPRMSELRP